jgi:hypothetical protein
VKSNRITVVAIAGDLGFGFPEQSLTKALAARPDAIVVQGTSADPGPYYLGAGDSFYPLGGVERDLERLLPATTAARIPLVMSAGGSGARATIEPVVQIIRRVARTRQLSFRLAVVYSDVERAYLEKRIGAGDVISRLGDWPALSPTLSLADVRSSTNIVAQIGPEPIISALKAGADVVLTGRSVDVSLFAAVPLLRGIDAGPAIHMSKILECGAMAAIPGSSADGLLATIENGAFTVEPLSPDRRCTIRSVAGHSFYEREDPFCDDLPGGALDTLNSTYEQVDSRTVRIAGARWVPAPYTVKLEGAEIVGHRTFCLAGIRDPIMIAQLDAILESARDAVGRRFQESARRWELIFRQYGRNAVMGAVERSSPRPVEVGLLMDVVAQTAELADEICGYVRAFITHDEFPGCRTSAGNLAFPFSPSDTRTGPVYRFNIWHLLRLDDPIEPFRIEQIDFGKSATECRR